MKYRIPRVNELIKKELSEIIQKNVELENALMTIIDVETSKDLSYAKVKISVLPENKTTQVLEELNKNIFRIQRMINKRLKMKSIPKIKFELI